MISAFWKPHRTAPQYDLITKKRTNHGRVTVRNPAIIRNMGGIYSETGGFGIVSSRCRDVFTKNHRPSIARRLFALSPWSRVWSDCTFIRPRGFTRKNSVWSCLLYGTIVLLLIVRIYIYVRYQQHTGNAFFIKCWKTSAVSTTVNGWNSTLQAAWYIRRVIRNKYRYCFCELLRKCFVYSFTPGWSDRIDWWRATKCRKM